MSALIRWAKVTHQFEGIHSYPSAPEEVSFLRHPHRHIFHVVVYVEQHHNERDVEYIMLKRWLQGLFDSPPGLSSESCETIAETIGEAVKAHFPGRKVMVEVNEDGENGALLEFGL